MLTPAVVVYVMPSCNVINKAPVAEDTKLAQVHPATPVNVAAPSNLNIPVTESSEFIEIFPLAGTVMSKKFLLFVLKVVKDTPETTSVEVPAFSTAVALIVIVVPEITVSVVAPMFSVPAVTVKALVARPHVIFVVNVTAPAVSIITGLVITPAEPPQFPVPVNRIVPVPEIPPIV